MIDMNNLAIRTTRKEGKAQSLSNGQVKEVIRCFTEVLCESPTARMVYAKYQKRVARRLRSKANGKRG